MTKITYMKKEMKEQNTYVCTKVQCDVCKKKSDTAGLRIYAETKIVPDSWDHVEADVCSLECLRKIEMRMLKPNGFKEVYVKGGKNDKRTL